MTAPMQIAVIVFLLAVYAGSGLVELFRWRKLIPQYERWGYPGYWSLVTAAIKLAGGVLVLLPQTRLLGVALCAGVAVCALYTVLAHREKALYPVALPVLALTLIAGGWLAWTGVSSP